MVRGVDLFPPPVTWAPRNCALEVDDILKDWTWRQKFDLIHMRFMAGSFHEDEWREVYAKIFQWVADNVVFEDLSANFPQELGPWWSG